MRLFRDIHYFRKLNAQPHQLGKEEFFVSLVRQESRRIGSAYTKSIVVVDASRFLLEFSVIALIVGLFSIALLGDFANKLSLPVVGTFMIAILRLVPTTQKSINAILRIRFLRPQVINLARELRQVFRFSPDRTEHQRFRYEHARSESQFVQLSLKNVCFRYPGRDNDVLNDA